ncbi:MAG: GGDEF domain-containing protein [Gammaproteobacteria bacterium]|nr:GGDEF domain-containing protein [Gammaproteobacteria bacterium]
MTLPDIRDEIERIDSVVVARFAMDGRLLSENTGFSRLHSGMELRPWQLLTRPRFDELVRAEPDAQGRIHSGKLTLGDPEGGMRTLIGNIYTNGEEILMIAGYDIHELEQMADALLDLNNQLDAAHRELVQANRELGKREESVRRISLTDALTGAGNRRKFDDELPLEVDHARRHGYPLSLVMLDLDHFKEYNDTLGHEAGDRVLRDLGVLFREGLRQADLFYRMGGEEFVVLMPGLDQEEVAAAAERLRRLVEAQPLDKTITVTASFGVATLEGKESGENLLARADAAMYRAKRGGRNRVVEAGAGE